MLTHFHFLQPLWLLALLPLATLLWSIARRADASTPWRKLVDAELLPLLLEDRKTRRSKIPLWLLSVGWLLAVLALADPTWEQQPQPLLQTTTSRVIVLDLSRSMLVPDVKPSRLVRARFKVEDILSLDAEGQTGLVVFAGDAFTVSPLTRDADTIRAQLKALHPSIMPSQGSRADLGLLKAQELLQQAGVKNGQVILLADGVQGDRANAAASQLHASGFDVSVLGVGTPHGAPLPDGRGGTLRDESGKPLVPGLEETALASVARDGGGRYTSLRGDQGDLDYVLESKTSGDDSIRSEDMQAQKWKEQGPLLAVLLLPVAALAFRRGWLLGIVLCAGTLAPPQPAMALGWDQLWQRNDQRAAAALDSGDYERAVQLAEDPVRRGSARYRKGDFENALQDFTQAPGADAAYNRGNALARLSRYKEAIAAYDQALELQPGMEDALANKAAVEELLNQQSQKQESSEQQDNPDQSSQQDQASASQNDAEQQESASADPGESAQQDQNEQADSDSGGNHENAAQSEKDQASDPQTGEQKNAENQFAEANRQLDKQQDDPQSESEQNASQPEPHADDEQGDIERQTAEQARPTDRQARPDVPESRSEAEVLNDEEKMAAQQWLRRIPDDPGGLLRRKFLYQYRQRAGRSDISGHQQW